MKYFACLLLVLSSTGLAAASAPDCSSIEDSEERLACYDMQYPQPAATGEAPPPVTDSEPVVTQQTISESPDVPPPPPAEPAAPAAPAVAGAGTTFFGDTKVDLTSTIKAIGGGEKQKMIFLLDNEEVWMQSSPRPLPFEEGDTVTIKNATLGGYFMRSEKGASTRVQRVE